MKGIYKILNTENNKIYIGKCENFIKRKKEHLKLLRKKKHFNIHLQYAFDKYGEDKFMFILIEECDDLNDKEVYYINEYNSLDKAYGYNLQAGGLGGKHSEETILKQKLNKEEKAKKIYGFNKEGMLIKEWFSIKECSKELNVNTCDIRRTIKQKQYSCKSFILQDSSIFDNRLTPSQKASNRRRDSKGLFMGGVWRRPDGMHFQLASI